MPDRARVIVTDEQGGIVDQFWIVTEGDTVIFQSEVRGILEETFVIQEVTK